MIVDKASRLQEDGTGHPTTIHNVDRQNIQNAKNRDDRTSKRKDKQAGEA